MLIKEEKETFSLSSLSSLRENDPDEKDISREDFREKLCRVFLFVKNENVRDLGSSSSSRDEVNRNRTHFGGKIYTHTHARA